MPNWYESMTQSFDYYVVDPRTWKDTQKLDTVLSMEITRDDGVETLGSASIDLNEVIGECYIRPYLVTIQNGVKERFPLGTYLIQTPSSSFNGLYRTISADAYTPLIELKESPLPLGYYTRKESNIMQEAFYIAREHMRAPVIKPECEELLTEDFVSNNDDTWLTYISDLCANAKYELRLDDLGKLTFAPIQDTASLRPMVTFDDSNSSILYSDIDMTHDLYGIPNVVEVLYSDKGQSFYSKIVNDDPNSPVSTVNRGREILYRDTSPSFVGLPSQRQVDEYATRLLKELSAVEYTISYTHGYYPVRPGDCVRLDYKKAGITNTKAKIISQSISLEPGCPVSETAVFTTKLWG